jgi:hypothetical protein
MATVAKESGLPELASVIFPVTFPLPPCCASREEKNKRKIEVRMKTKTLDRVFD